MIKSRLKKWLCIGLISCTAVGAAFALSSCEKETATKDEYQKAYDLYVVYTEANGETPASYEDWLADIRGPRGAKGDKGDKGEKGDKGDKGDTPVITIGENGNWFVDGVDTGMPSCGEGVDHTHQWEEPIVLRPATCVENGFSVQYCSVCEEDKVVVDVAIGKHSYEEGVCDDCDDLQTKGLVYELNAERTAYIVSDYTGTDSEVYIAARINDLPVTTIGEYAFHFCTSLTEITIPSSVTTMGGPIFGGCTDLTNITVETENTAYQSIDGNLYTKDGKTLVYYAPGKTQTSFAIPNSVTTIGDRAFYDCNGLTNIKIPNGVTTIDSNAFYNCRGLTNIIIPNSVTTIGEYAFGFCTGLTNITISNSVTTIGDRAFYDCNGLTKITIPSSVTSIGNSAFDFCENLSNVYYEGTASDWEKMTIADGNDILENATRYYYVEKEADVPTDGGKYWHYDEEGNIVVWGE